MSSIQFCHNKNLGLLGETFAAAYLCSQQGHRLVLSRWRWSRYAELDLVTWHEESQTYHLIEVKTRQGRMGSAFEANTAKKQAHMLTAAQGFMSTWPHWQAQNRHLALQLDWLFVSWPLGLTLVQCQQVNPKIEWIQNVGAWQ
jgi:Holliday junction resolvase-like predicted endonuclease